MTIRIGQDMTPAVVSFGKDLLAAGQWFGKNKWALEALGAAAGSIVAGAAVIKTISVGEKIVSGVKYLVGGTSTAGLAGNTGALSANTLALQELTGKLALGGAGVPGVVGGGEGTELVEGGGLTALLGGKSLTAFVRGAAFKTALGAAALFGYNSVAEPYLKKHLTPQEDRTANDVAHGAIVLGTIGSWFGPEGTLVGGTLGALGGLLGSFSHPDTTPNPIFTKQLQQRLSAAQTAERNAQGSLSVYERTHPGLHSMAYEGLVFGGTAGRDDRAQRPGQSGCLPA